MKLSRESLFLWNIKFAYIIRCIWLNINNFVFKNTELNHYQIAMKSHKMAISYFEAFHNNLSNENANSKKLIHWNFPSSGLVKINTNGRKMDYGYASYGGLARTEEGCWIEGFYSCVGSTVLGAEL